MSQILFLCKALQSMRTFPNVITARKRSLGQGNIFRSVCQEFCPQGGSASLHAGNTPHLPPPPGTRGRHPPPSPREQTRILLECNLVWYGLTKWISFYYDNLGGTGGTVQWQWFQITTPPHWDYGRWFSVPPKLRTNRGWSVPLSPINVNLY